LVGKENVLDYEGDARVSGDDGLAGQPSIGEREAAPARTANRWRLLSEIASAAEAEQVRIDVQSHRELFLPDWPAS
jgi:hypothetical protein